MIELTHQDAMTTITLNRPDKANALTRRMLGDLVTAVNHASDTDAKILVLTGVGRVFSAGADLDAARSTDLTTDPVWEQLSTAVARFKGLSIAALNGTVAGGALGMVLACDLRIAVAGTKVFYPVLRNGFLPQPSDPVRMRALIGPGRTKMVFLAGQKIDTETALSWGLFDQVVPVGTLAQTINTLSTESRAATLEIVKAIKALCED